jgi:O-antigen/teichoic acid export membrane protein
MRYTLILSLAGLMVAGLLMKNVLSLWVGSEYEFLAPYALVLFTSVSFMLSTSVAHHMLKGLEKLRAVILIYFFGLVVVPIVSILIIFNIWHDPYVSVTFGLAAGHLLCGGLQIWFCTRVVHADIWQVFMRAYAQPLIVASVVCGVFFVIAAYVGIEGLIAQIFVSLLISLAFFGGCYALIFNSAERQQLQEIVQVIKNKITLNSKEMPEAR